jgi:hypothetical protein
MYCVALVGYGLAGIVRLTILYNEDVSNGKEDHLTFHPAELLLSPLSLK